MQEFVTKSSEIFFDNFFFWKNLYLGSALPYKLTKHGIFFSSQTNCIEQLSFAIYICIKYSYIS